MPLLLLSSLAVLSARVSPSIGSSEKRIMDHIFAGYTPFVRPVRSHNHSIKVVLDPALYGIYEVNEAQETITFSHWHRANWQDEYLQWDPEDFDGVEMIKPPGKLLWQPDITLYGMIGVTNTLERDRSLVHLNYTGHVLLSVGQNIRVHCTYDVSKFPYDHQECILHYTSWMYHDGEVSLYPKTEEGVKEYFQRNTEWTLDSFEGKRKIFTYVEGTYSEVFYTIRMARKPLYYMLTIVVPSFTITSLAIIGLFSPFNSCGERQEKVTMGLTTLLTMAVLLLMVSNEMPKTSDGMPLLGMFIMVELLLASFATVCAVLVMYLHRYGSEREPSEWLLRLTGIRTPDLCCRFQAASEKAAVNLRNFRQLSSEPNGPTSTRLSLGPAGKPLLHRAEASNGTLAHTRIGGVGPAGGADRTALLHFCVENLREMSTVVSEWKAENEMAGLWTRICDRVDVFLIVLFLLIHLAITFFFFGPML